MPSEKSTKLTEIHPIQITVQPAPPTQGHWASLAPVASSAIIAVATVWAVHKLTQRREHEKAVFELHRSITEATKDIREAAETGWTTTAAAKRKEAVANTLWQLQRVGGMVGQMERLSKRRKMLFWSCAMNANTAMAALRDGITLGDFDDDTRNQRPSEVPHVRAMITTFLEQLDQALYSWMR